MSWEELTIPVMWMLPTSGNLFFTPRPGFNGPFPNVIIPICSSFPREASIAIMKGLSNVF